LEDIGPLRAAEVRPEDLTLYARRAHEPLEDRIIEAEELAKHSENLALEGFDTSAISLEDSLNAEPSLTITVEGDLGFLDNVRTGYADDPILGPIITNPLHFAQFTVQDGLIYCNSPVGAKVLCIPRTPRSGGTRLLTEIVLDQSHQTLGHYGELRTSEYVRRWYWW
ncbi:hypothetical protein B0H13DRAFT_1566802, partial [Mycena leptocephala]